MDSIGPRDFHPALEAVDAAGGLARGMVEPTAVWLHAHGLLSRQVAVAPPNGDRAKADEVLADIYLALRDGDLMFNGVEFVVTSTGCQKLAATSRPPLAEIRECLRNAPTDPHERLRQAEHKLFP